MKNLSPSWLFQFQILSQIGSFTETALRFGLSQQALSRNIQMLERWAGQSLITRLPGGLAITPAGYLVLQEIPDLLQTLQKICWPVLPVHQELKIGVSSFWNVCYLAPCLQQLYRQHPETELQILPLAEKDILAFLMAGELDMGLVLSPPDPGLSAKALPSVPWVLAGAPHLSEKSCFPFLILNSPELPCAFHESHLLPQPNQFLGYTNSLSILRELLLLGYAGGFIPWPYVSQDIKFKRLRVFDTPELPWLTPHAVWLRDISKAPGLQLLLSALDREMAQ